MDARAPSRDDAAAGPQCRDACRIIGLVASGCLISTSVAINGTFGYTLGARAAEQYLIALGLGSFDVLKALALPLLAGAIAERRWLHALAAVLVGSAGIIASATASIGFIALNRAETLGPRVGHGAIFRVSEEQLAQALKERLNMHEHAIVAELEAQRTQLLARPMHGRKATTGAATSDCRRSTTATHTTCDGVHALAQRIAAARARDALDARISMLRESMETNVGAAGYARGDPQVEALAHLVGQSAVMTTTALQVLFALIIELGSSLGLVLSLSLAEGARHAAIAHGSRENAISGSRDTDALITAFWRACVRTDTEATTPARVLTEALVRYCDAHDVPPHVRPSEKALGAFRKRQGITAEKLGGRVHYRGIALGPEHGTMEP